MSLAFQVELWNRQNKLGIVFDSSTGFKLSNGATLSWIAIERWNSLSDKQKRGFAPIDPDFASQRVVEVHAAEAFVSIEATDEGIIELMSPIDDLSTTQTKMEEYLNCGVKLGWLINPDEKQVALKD